MTKKIISIDIEVEGDFPNKKEMALRDKIEKELIARNIGKFVGSGGGLGAMDISFLVDDESTSRDAMQNAIQRYAPQAKYSIDSQEFDGDESELDDDFDDDEAQISLPRLIIFGTLVLAILAVLLYAMWSLIAWLF